MLHVVCVGHPFNSSSSKCTHQKLHSHPHRPCSRLALSLFVPCPLYQSSRSWTVPKLPSVSSTRPNVGPLLVWSLGSSLPSSRSEPHIAIDKKTASVKQISSDMKPIDRKKKWKNVNVLLMEIQAFCQQHHIHDRMPTSQELARHHRPDIRYAIRKFGGWFQVARLMGVPLTSQIAPKSLYLSWGIDPQPQRYWKEFDTLKNELYASVKHQWKMQREFDNMGRYCLQQKQQHHHQQQQQMMMMMMRSEDLGSGSHHPQELHETHIVYLLHQLPSTYLLQQNRSDIMEDINKHGGMNAIAKRMAVKSRYYSRGYWANLKNIETELRLLMDEYNLGNQMPDYKLVASLGPNGLNRAIQLAGGRNKLAKMYNMETKRKPKNYWDNIDHIHQELIDFISTSCGTGDLSQCRMPSRKELVQAGRHNLAKMITLRGGFKTTAQTLGLRYDPAPWSLKRIEKCTRSPQKQKLDCKAMHA